MADGKWRGALTDVIAAPIDKVWAIIADFDGYQKHFPQLFSSCKTIEGEANKVGSLRLITGHVPDGIGVLEIHERHISLDDVNHTTSYVVEKINFGWTGYKATVVATSPEDDQTSIVWSFEVDPISGQTKEELTSVQHGVLKAILSLTKQKLAK